MSLPPTSPTTLLGMAVTVTSTAQPELRGCWPRAACLLARQGLETAIDELWATVAPPGKRISERARLLCLTEYLPANVASDVTFVWAALSRACHYHPYELSPSGNEIETLLELTQAAITSLTAARG